MSQGVGNPSPVLIRRRAKSNRPACAGGEIDHIVSLAGRDVSSRRGCEDGRTHCASDRRRCRPEASVGRDWYEPEGIPSDNGSVRKMVLECRDLLATIAGWQMTYLPRSPLEAASSCASVLRFAARTGRRIPPFFDCCISNLVEGETRLLSRWLRLTRRTHGTTISCPAP